jgi:hypothetical protein
MTITECPADLARLIRDDPAVVGSLGTHLVPAAMAAALSPVNPADPRGQVWQLSVPLRPQGARLSTVFAADGWVGAQVVAVAADRGMPEVCLTGFQPLSGGQCIVFHSVNGVWTQLLPAAPAGSRALSLWPFYAAEIAALEPLVAELAAQLAQPATDRQ